MKWLVICTCGDRIEGSTKKEALQNHRIHSMLSAPYHTVVDKNHQVVEIKKG